MSHKELLPTDLDLTALDLGFCEHPLDRLDRLRCGDPVHLEAALGRFFLTRFEDISAVLADRSLSKDPRKAPRRRAMMGDVPPEALSMNNLDDPGHKRLWGLVSQAFNQRSVDTWRPRNSRHRRGAARCACRSRLLRCDRRICGAITDCRDRRDAARRSCR